MKEALEEAAYRSDKTDLPDAGSDEENSKRLAFLIDWGMKGFPPNGADGLKEKSKNILISGDF